MSREICKACFRPSSVGFAVPDEVWAAVKPERLPGDVLCLQCFTTLADEQLIPWDRDIQFYPVSLATLHGGFDGEYSKWFDYIE